MKRLIFITIWSGIILLVSFVSLVGQTHKKIASAAYTHVTKKENTAKHITTLDHVAANGNPQAIILVMQKYGVYNAHEVGVWYNGGKWRIFNQDRSPMPMNLQFNVMILDPTQVNSAFTISTTSSNTSRHITTLNHRLTNSKPNAMVLVTQRYGKYNTSPVGLWYNAGKWTLYNETRQDMPIGTQFNVLVLKQGAIQNLGTLSGSSFVHRVNDANKKKFASKHVTYSAHSFVTNKPGMLLFSNTRYLKAYNAHTTGVWYDKPSWTLFNQNRKPIPSGVAFNVVAINPTLLYRPVIRPGTVTLPTQQIPGTIYTPIGKSPVFTRWQDAVRIDPEQVVLVPGVNVNPRPAPNEEEEEEPSDEVLGPNLGLGKDVKLLFGDAAFNPFVEKLNIFRELYEDQNPNKGYFYYLPANYHLKWSRETGEYSFFIYYMSADEQGRGEVNISAELSPSINHEDIELAEEILSKSLGKEIVLLPIPLVNTPKVSFGNMLRNYDVLDESVHTNVPTDFLKPIVVSWNMGRRVDDLVGAMMTNIGIVGEITFEPFGSTEREIKVPVKIKVNDMGTYGKLEFENSAQLLNGFTNNMDYPVVLKSMEVMRQKQPEEHSMESLSLGSYSIEPGHIFSGFSDVEKNKLLGGDLINKIWVDYELSFCSPCNQAVKDKILGGTSDALVKAIEVEILTPLAYSGASSLKVLIKSMQGDPKQETEVILPMLTISTDNTTLMGGELFVPEGEDPAFDYQLIQIMPNGEAFSSEWIPSSNLLLVIGEKTIIDHLEEEPVEE